MKYRILFFLKWKASGFIKKVWPNSSISVHHKTNMRKISILKFRRNATQLQNSLRIFARRPQTRAHASALAFQTLAFFFFLWRCGPTRAIGLLMLEVSGAHTTTHHSRPDSSGRVISPSQRPLPDNTKHSTQIKHSCPGGIRNHNPSRRAAEDPRLRQCSHWDR